MRNDPGFMLAASSTELSSHSKPMFKSDSQRAVAVFRTGVSPNTAFTLPYSQATSKSTSREDPAKHCLLHNRAHPLHKCRGFRERPMCAKSAAKPYT
jgi:hypothetical protein